MYFDTCYIAKFYFNEPDSARVRDRVLKAPALYSSQWAFAEFHATLHRHMREGEISSVEARALAARFSDHIEERLWNLIPVSEALLRRTCALLLSAPAGLLLRTADAVHLTTAQELEEKEVWTNDRHMLAAAQYFGLTGRTV